MLQCNSRRYVKLRRKKSEPGKQAGMLRPRQGTGVSVTGSLCPQAAESEQVGHESWGRELRSEWHTSQCRQSSRAARWPGPSEKAGWGREEMGSERKKQMSPPTPICILFFFMYRLTVVPFFQTLFTSFIVVLPEYRV